MLSVLARLASLLLLGSGNASGDAVVAFDGAAASSTYAGGDFAATEALSKGSGYWCSAGNHAPGQSVTWTGTLAARQKIVGVTLNWAYGPGEYKVLTSADGGNFQEAACWRSAKRKEVSYRETLMFEAPRNVKALTVVMRSPMPWGYFALNDVALLVEPGPMMLISGTSSEAGERCVVAHPESLGSEDCLKAIAGGTGREIFAWNTEAQIVSTVENRCISLASGAAASGGLLALQDCTMAAEAGDGRSNFELTATGQLKFKYMGNYCVVASRDGLRVQDCGAAEEGGVARDKFFLAAIPEFDPTHAAEAMDVAVLLRASAARQESVMAALHAAMPRLDTCRLALSANASRAARQPLMLARLSSGLTEEKSEAAEKALAGMYTALGVDMASIKALLAESAGALALASSKAKLASE